MFRILSNGLPDVRKIRTIAQTSSESKLTKAYFAGIHSKVESVDLICGIIASRGLAPLLLKCSIRISAVICSLNQHTASESILPTLSFHVRPLDITWTENLGPDSRLRLTGTAVDDCSCTTISNDNVKGCAIDISNVYNSFIKINYNDSSRLHTTLKAHLKTPASQERKMTSSAVNSVSYFVTNMMSQHSEPITLATRAIS